MTDALKKLRDEAERLSYWLHARTNLNIVEIREALAPLNAAIREQEAEKPLQLREGGWYQRRDGKVVGPAKLLDPDTDHPWKVDAYWYSDSGAEYSYRGNYGLIREVPAPEAVMTLPEISLAELATMTGSFVRPDGIVQNVQCSPGLRMALDCIEQRLTELEVLKKEAGE